MRFRIIAAISSAALGAVAGLVAFAQPPAETRDGNKAGYKPAFAGQTRAPALTTDTKFEVKEVIDGWRDRIRPGRSSSCQAASS